MNDFFTFSKTHDYQGNPAVKQMLVFSSSEMQARFEHEYNKRVAQDGVENASDNDIGAVFKCRAVQDINGKWIPIIRCGYAGMQIWEGRQPRDFSDLALDDCIVELLVRIVESISKKRTHG